MRDFIIKLKSKMNLTLCKFLNLNVCKRLAVFNRKRNDNSSKYKMTNFLLMFLFPLFIVCLAEINQMKTPTKFILFVFEKPAIMLFNILLATMIFWSLVLLLKKGFWAIFSMGVLYFSLSTVELFKFNTSGNHLILTDMKMAVNMGNVARFAYIKITPELVIYISLLIIYFIAAFLFNPTLKIKPLKRMVTAFACVAAGFSAILIPSIAMPVYAFFDVDTTQADNVFKVNEKFENNNFLAFFVETATENLNKKLVVPANYNAENIDKIVENKPVEENSDFVKPNVIVIMSEAFTDFRRFPELNVPDEYYKGWDAVAAEGHIGKAVVPTFASFTVRTEFELNFGLPVKSLNDLNMPQRILLNRAQPTIAQYYKDLGYNTDYIHTFSRTFYSRGRIYANFGFDNMYFDDNLTVPTEYAGSYISDKTIFNQITKILKDNTDAPTFIHTTTMQDHQPYDVEGKTELQAYLERVQDMTNNLQAFTNELKNIDRPTVVLMIGDHLPCFKGSGNAYEQLNMNGDNCNSLYEQPYLVWSNYNLDYSKLPTEEVSSFYLPYAMMNLIDAPKDAFVETMLDKMKEVPIYSTTYDNTIPNDTQLDMVTYDRILGDKLSDNTSSTQKDLEKKKTGETTTTVVTPVKTKEAS